MAVIDAYRTADDCVCPRCFGIPHIVEVWWQWGQSYRIENKCGLCQQQGRVPRTVSQQFWLAHPPTA
jgi:hypothetical protein